MTTPKFNERKEFTERAFKINLSWGFSWEEEEIDVAAVLRILAMQQSDAVQPSLRSRKWMGKKFAFGFENPDF